MAKRCVDCKHFGHGFGWMCHAPGNSARVTYMADAVKERQSGNCGPEAALFEEKLREKPTLLERLFG